MTTVLPDIQYHFREGLIELKAGYPDVTVFPAEGLSQAAQLVLRREATQALLYGAQQGPGCFIKHIQGWMERSDHHSVQAEQIMITGGTSQTLDMLCTLYTKPGDAVLVQSPTYNLGLRLLREYQLDLIPVQSDDNGIEIDALENTLQTLEQQGRQPRFFYLVPTFSNPATLTFPLERRQAILKIARRFNLRIIEDDAYRDLWYESPPPPSLFRLDSEGLVIHLRSFSKILGPGLRLGWMLAPPDIVQQCAGRAVFVSGGGPNHFTAHVVSAFLELGQLDEHVDMLRARYRERRNRLERALKTHLGEACQWLPPQGGFFLWLQLPEGVNSEELITSATDTGVSFLPGTSCFVNGGGENFCRLTFTMTPPDELEEGVRRLQQALQQYQ